MIVRCTNCRTAFSVNDSKIKNKKFSFNCPKCSEENIFDNRTDHEEHDLESLPAATAPDFSDSTYAEERIVDRSTNDRATARTESFDLPEPDSSGITSEFESETVEGTIEAFDELPGESAEIKSAGRKEPDLSLDDIDTNINLDDIDIDIGTEEKSRKDDESDFILDEMESGDRTSRKDDTILDELSDELSDTSRKGESLEDVNIDDILLPEDDAKKRNADRGDILDLEEDLVTLEEVDYESKNDVSHDNDIASDSILIDAEDERSVRSKKGDEEDITLDLDSLDIDLDGDEELLREVKRGTQKGGSEPQKAVSANQSSEEDLTLDLDSLDIELSEDEMVMEGEHPDDVDLLPIMDDKKKQHLDHDKEDDLTLDLDSLDITLEETEEFMEGEVLDEDEKLTLQDAGLTIEELTTDESATALEGHHDDEEEDIKLTLDEIDPSLSGDLSELTTDEINATMENEEEEEIKLSIDEIDPNLKVDEIGDDFVIEDLPVKSRSRTTGEDENLLIDEIEELPEIDLEDELLVETGTAAAAAGAGLKRGKNRRIYEEESIDIELQEDDEYPIKHKKGLSDITVKGAVSLSIDYSIKYSRIGALIRLLGIFGIALIPHFIVLLIYTVLSAILGFINHLIVLIRRDSIEDFSQIIENTIRYFISIYSSLVGIVEDFPIFTGKDNVDHPLQMKVTYPLHNSRLMAFLRLTVVGVLIALFPHLLIAGILSLVIPLMYIVGIIAVLILGRWPSMLFDFFTRYYRYCAKIFCFGTGIVDEYPSFKFE